MSKSLAVVLSPEKSSAKPAVSVGFLIEAEALFGLGCVAHEMHDYERSLKYHCASLAIAQGIGSLELESRAYGAIGSAYNAIGELAVNWSML